MGRINFLAIQSESRSNNASVQNLENMFLEENTDGTKLKFIVRTRDGSSIAVGNVVSEFPNSNLALSGSIVNGTIYGLFDTAYDATNTQSVAGGINNFLYDLFTPEHAVSAFLPGMDLVNHTSGTGQSWVKSQSNINSGTIVLSSLGEIEPSNDIFGEDGNTFYSITNVANDFESGYTLSLGEHQVYPTTGGSLGASFMYALSFSNSNYWEGVQFQGRSNIAASNGRGRFRYVRVSGGVISNSSTTVDSTYGLEDKQTIKFEISPNYTHCNIVNFHGDYLANIPIPDSTNHIVSNTIAIGGFQIETGGGAFDVKVRCNISSLSTFTIVTPLASQVINPAKTIIIYDGVNTSNLYIGSINDGQITNTKAIVKTFFHTTDEPISMTYGTSNILFAGADSNFVVTEKDLSNVTYVTKPEFINTDVGSVAFLAGTYYYSSTTSDKIWASALETPTSWPVTRYATAEYAGDNIAGLLVFKDNLWVFGSRVTEVFYNSGNADFPAARMPNGIIHLGVIGKAYTASMGAIYAVGFYKGTAGVWQILGYDIQKISTPEIDRWITSRFDYDMPYKRPFFLSTYQQEDHVFVVLNRLGGDNGFPPDISPDPSGRCYVFDEATKTWHKRTVLLGSGKSLTGYPYTWFVPVSPGYQRVGRYAMAAGPASNCVAEIRLGIGTDVLGTPSGTTKYEITNYVKRMQGPHITGEDKNLFHSKFRLDTDETSSNVIVTLRSTDDDGDSYANHGVRDLSGRQFIEWYRLGSAEDRVYEIESTSNALLDISGAFLDVTTGKHSGGRS